MLAYGYEQPVVFTPQQLFNPQSANTVVNSMWRYADLLEKDYERAREDYKDFMKDYGTHNFSSGVEGANEAYYNETAGRMNNLINKYGIDNLLRSQEGQQLLKQAIANTDYAKLNALQKQAQDYDAYRKMRREMVAKGLTTDEYEDWKLRKLGLDKFTAIRDGYVQSWDRLSPDPLRSIQEITDNIYNKLSPNTPNGTIENGKYNILSVSANDRLNAKIAGLDEMRKNPAYEYYKEMAGGSDEALADLIEASNAKYLKDQLQENKDYEMKLQLHNTIAAQTHRYNLDQKGKEEDLRRQREQWADPNNPAVIKAKTAEKLANLKANGSGGSSGKEPMSVIKTMYKNGLAAAFNVPATLLNDDYVSKNIYSLQADKLKQLATYKDSEGKTVVNYNKIPARKIFDIFRYDNDPETLKDYLPYPKVNTTLMSDDAKSNLTGTELVITQDMIKNLHAFESIARNVAGYSGTNKNSLTSELRKNLIENGDGSIYGYCKVNTSAYTPLMKNGRVVMYQNVTLYDADGDKITDCLLDTKIQSDSRPGGQYITEDKLNTANSKIRRDQPIGLDSRMQSYYDTAGTRANKSLYGGLNAIGTGSINQDDYLDNMIMKLMYGEEQTYGE